MEGGLGARVIRAVSRAGGFSPGLASRLDLADGRRAFAKAVGTGWRRLAAGPLPGIDPWAPARLDELAGLESRWAAAAAGTSLVHGDLRADNALLSPPPGLPAVRAFQAAQGVPALRWLRQRLG
ncbi:hypothetical protein [Saccharothrix syringae]|uniref:Aminoglycoside phosphotransferase domain-containing protein n=1 Tax=Saccharothrix syringae TaxID=103733 RepID=A0A5Q0HCS0_SACSY|nr:hypothetical protein [Saccharothrix syringae]QFZ23899.1 hypothetical protein EKG83_46395 [Saccharothrix syringae]